MGLFSKIFGVDLENYELKHDQLRQEALEMFADTSNTMPHILDNAASKKYLEPPIVCGQPTIALEIYPHYQLGGNVLERSDIGDLVEYPDGYRPRTGWIELKTSKKQLPIGTVFNIGFDQYEVVSIKEVNKTTKTTTYHIKEVIPVGADKSYIRLTLNMIHPQLNPKYSGTKLIDLIRNKGTKSYQDIIDTIQIVRATNKTN